MPMQAVLADHFTTAEWARCAQGGTYPNPNPNPYPYPKPNPYPSPNLKPYPGTRRAALLRACAGCAATLAAGCSRGLGLGLGLGLLGLGL